MDISNLRNIVFTAKEVISDKRLKGRKDSALYKQLAIRAGEDPSKISKSRKMFDAFGLDVGLGGGVRDEKEKAIREDVERRFKDDLDVRGSVEKMKKHHFKYFEPEDFTGESREAYELFRDAKRNPKSYSSKSQLSLPKIEEYFKGKASEIKNSRSSKLAKAQEEEVLKSRQSKLIRSGKASESDFDLSSAKSLLKKDKEEKKSLGESITFGGADILKELKKAPKAKEEKTDKVGARANPTYQSVNPTAKKKVIKIKKPSGGVVGNPVYQPVLPAPRMKKIIKK